MIPRMMSSSLKQFVAEETERCEDFVKRLGRPHGLGRWSVSSFVKRCLLLHKKLIEQWESTMFFGEPVSTGKQITEDAVTKTTILSVRPSHFLYLGHLCESVSCFSNEHENSVYKVRLGIKIPRSFVVLNYRGTESVAKPSFYRPQGRAWGMVTDNGILVTNFYGLSHHVARHAVVKACEKAFGVSNLRYLGLEDPGVCASVPHLPHRKLMYINSDAHLLKP